MSRELVGDPLRAVEPVASPTGERPGTDRGKMFGTWCGHLIAGARVLAAAGALVVALDRLLGRNDRP